MAYLPGVTSPRLMTRETSISLSKVKKTDACVCAFFRLNNLCRADGNGERDHPWSKLRFDSEDKPFSEPRRSFQMNIRNKTLPMVLAIGALLSLTARGQAQRLPVYEVARTAAPIKVDGKLDDPAWAKTRAVGDFVNNS